MLGVEEPKLPSTGYTHMPCVCVHLCYKNSKNCTDVQSQHIRSSSTETHFLTQHKYVYCLLQGTAVLDCLISENNNCNHAT